MPSSDPSQLNAPAHDLSVVIDDSTDAVINNYRNDEKSDTIASTWNARLASMSVDLIGAAPVDKKKLSKAQKRRIEKCRIEITQFNMSIDALNVYFSTWFKKFETGEIGREQLVTNIVAINALIIHNEKQRDIAQLQLSQLAAN